MIRILNYVGIAILAFTLFSCSTKNEWSKENEAEFKEGVKEGLRNKLQGKVSEDQITYIADCAVEKIKAKNLQINDLTKSENLLVVAQSMKECSEQWNSKNGSITSYGETDQTWNAKNEENYKILLKQMLKQDGAEDNEATFLADCIVQKCKEEKISPADLDKSENDKLIETIGATCGLEWVKQN